MFTILSLYLEASRFKCYINVWEPRKSMVCLNAAYGLFRGGEGRNVNQQLGRAAGLQHRAVSRRAALSPGSPQSHRAVAPAGTRLRSSAGGPLASCLRLELVPSSEICPRRWEVPGKGFRGLKEEARLLGCPPATCSIPFLQQTRNLGCADLWQQNQAWACDSSPSWRSLAAEPVDLCNLCSLTGSRAVGDGCLDYGSLLANKHYLGDRSWRGAQGAESSNPFVRLLAICISRWRKLVSALLEGSRAEAVINSLLLGSVKD